MHVVYLFFDISVLWRNGSSNLEFGQEVSIVWPKIIPVKNQTQVLLNNRLWWSSFNNLCLIACCVL